jgi:hypothetical protein
VSTTHGYPLLNNNPQAPPPYKAQRILLDITDDLLVFGITGAAVESLLILELG